MKKFIKIFCALMALMLCIGAAGCVSQAEIDLDGIISSDELEMVADTTPDELVVGQKIQGFGAYGGEALSWTVMDVDREGVALLLCDSVIDAKPFNTVRDVTHIRDNETPDLYDELYVLNWENCTLRAWLNGEFFASAFNSTEQARIYETELVTTNNPLTDRGEALTEDKVFLLSADEARDLFAGDTARKAMATANAKANGVRVGAESGASSYWLRTSGESMWHAAAVNTDGSVSYSGMSVENARIGVRPCIRLVSTIPGGEQIVALSSAVLGNIVEFGTYEQDNKPETKDEAIVWRVIDKEGSKLMLVAEKILDAHAYDTELKGDKWATCDLRSFLNGEFIETAFSSAEQAMLVETAISTEDNADYIIDSGADCTDKVFVLSKAEAEHFLSARNRGWEMAEATLYSQNRDGIGGTYDHGVKVDPDYGTAGWWLRDAGENDINAMYMFYYGEPCTNGTLVRNTFVGVRPCIWIDTAAD